VFLLNYKDTKNGKPSRAGPMPQAGICRGRQAGKGLVVYHHASSAFVGGQPWDKEFESLILGGWRKQGNHGKRHVFSVTIRKPDHPITQGLPPEFVHADDELYQNSVMLPNNEVLATAFSDKSLDPKNSGKHEPILWVATVGKGRVVENVRARGGDGVLNRANDRLRQEFAGEASRHAVVYPQGATSDRSPPRGLAHGREPRGSARACRSSRIEDLSENAVASTSLFGNMTEFWYSSSSAWTNSGGSPCVMGDRACELSR